MISHDYQCIFTHVPKTAGKSVRSMFGIPEFQRDFKPPDQRFEAVFGHRRLSDFRNAEYFGRYFKFSFVRNPFDRAVSAFFYLDGGGCNADDRKFRDDHLSIYDGNFAAFAEDVSRHLPSVHFMPQIDWLCDDDRKILSDYVGRYETLESDAMAIARKFGLATEGLPLVNPSAHRPYMSYCDDSGTRRRLIEAYGEDFETFSYST